MTELFSLVDAATFVVAAFAALIALAAVVVDTVETFRRADR